MSRTVSLAVALICAVGGYDVEAQTPSFQGIRFEAPSGRGDLLNRLAFQFEKCRTDTDPFADLLDSIRDGTGDSLKIAVKVFDHHIWPVSKRFSDDLSDLVVAVEDLLVLPDPTRPGFAGAFDSLPGFPKWASPVCAFLGHELAEVWEDTKANALNRAKHHGQIAIALEDSIANAYFPTGRKRGMHCMFRHRLHDDVVFEIRNLGIERYHKMEDRVVFDDDGFQRPKRKTPHALGYVEYDTVTFPGEIPSGQSCIPER